MYYVGIISALFLFATGAFLLYRVEGGVHLSVSQHAALSKRAKWYFAICYIIGTTTYNTFLIVWLSQKLEISIIWAPLIVVATACDWLLALVPETSGQQKLVHRFAAWSAAGLAFLFAISLVFNPLLSQSARIVVVLSDLGMLVLLVLLGFSSVAKQHFLIPQVLFVIFFYTATLAAAYL
jgi:hypothetical protein